MIFDIGGADSGTAFTPDIYEPAPETTPEPAVPVEDTDGYGLIKDALERYGLESLLPEVLEYVKKDFSVGWYLGVMKKQEYFDKATYLRKGEVDPSNNYTVRATCFNLPIDKLQERLE